MMKKTRVYDLLCQATSFLAAASAVGRFPLDASVALAREFQRHGWAARPLPEFNQAYDLDSYVSPDGTVMVSFLTTSAGVSLWEVALTSRSPVTYHFMTYFTLSATSGYLTVFNSVYRRLPPRETVVAVFKAQHKSVEIADDVLDDVLSFYDFVATHLLVAA